MRLIVVNLSGRGDKDVYSVLEALKGWTSMKFNLSLPT